MKKNKWTLYIADNYTAGGQTISRINMMAIPPTNGDRIDIVDEDGCYHYGMTKSDFNKKFVKKMTPEEYLEQTLPGLEGTEREKVLKGIEWTPTNILKTIAVIIEIKQGEITLKHK